LSLSPSTARILTWIVDSRFNAIRLNTYRLPLPIKANRASVRIIRSRLTLFFGSQHEPTVSGSRESESGFLRACTSRQISGAVFELHLTNSRFIGIFDALAIRTGVSSCKPPTLFLS